MQEEIKRIIENRTLQAINKQITLKLSLIAKNLGSPIVSEDGYGFGSSQTFMSDPWELENAGYESSEEAEINTYDEDASFTTIGYIFDGLKHGYHLEIKILGEYSKMENTLHSKEVYLYYHGHLVYHDIEGKLTCYYPLKEWEEVIDSYYDKAKKIEGNKNKQAKEERMKYAKKEAEGFWQKFRRTWGI